VCYYPTQTGHSTRLSPQFSLAALWVWGRAAITAAIDYGLCPSALLFKGNPMATSDPRDDSALQYALEELENLVVDNGLARSEIMALLEVMNIYEVLDYLDAKIANRLQ
jgi:hypothetical protein